MPLYPAGIYVLWSVYGIHGWVLALPSQPVPRTAVVLSRRQCHPVIKPEDRDPSSPINLHVCSQLADFANLLLKVADTAGH